MKFLIAILGLIVWSTAPASAQTPCFVTENGLSFQQWYQICGMQVAQICSALPAQFQGSACIQSVAQRQYQTYVLSQQASVACAVPGQRTCINGYVATCNGTQFMTSAQHC